MDEEFRLPCTRSEFLALLAEVDPVIDVTPRLPYLPFRASCGQVDVCEYDSLLAGSFAEVLCALADTHGDESIVLVTFEPDPFTYCTRKFPGFRIARRDLRERYREHLWYEIAGDTSGAIVDVSDAVALVGSTRTWSIYGQRNWGLTLVHSPAAQRPWLNGEVPFVSAREALEWSLIPPGFSPFIDAARSTFLSGTDAMAERPCG